MSVCESSVGSVDQLVCELFPLCPPLICHLFPPLSETALLDCHYYLRGNDRFLFDSHLPDIGQLTLGSVFVCVIKTQCSSLMQ